MSQFRQQDRTYAWESLRMLNILYYGAAALALTLYAAVVAIAFV